MAKIRPFAGYLPKPELAPMVASPPYDTLSSAEARELTKDNPHSFLHVVKPEIDFPVDATPTDEELSTKARENLDALIADGRLVRTAEPAYFIYKQTMDEHTQFGVAAGSSCAEYTEGTIKKHEHTLQWKEDMIMRHMSHMGSDAGQVLLTYPAHAGIDAFVAEWVSNHPPFIDYTADDGVGHAIWVVGEPTAEARLTQLFGEVEAMYIADGHHRASSAARIAAERRAADPNADGEQLYDYFLTVLLPDTQCRILDYNRVVRSLNGHTAAELVDQIALKFEIEELSVSDPEEARPEGRGEFAMYLDGKWRRLTVRPENVPNDPVQSLDVALLQNLVLKPLLGIANPRTDANIDFVGGIRGLKELVKRCDEDAVIGFGLHPTGADQMFRVADAGEVMPPKSTWFEPKQRSGIVVRLFEER